MEQTLKRKKIFSCLIELLKFFERKIVLDRNNGWLEWCIHVLSVVILDILNIFTHISVCLFASIHPCTCIRLLCSCVCACVSTFCRCARLSMWTVMMTHSRLGIQPSEVESSLTCDTIADTGLAKALALGRHLTLSLGEWVTEEEKCSLSCGAGFAAGRGFYHNRKKVKYLNWTR